MPLARFCRVQFSWPFMLVAIGGLLVLSALVVLGVRVLGRREAAEEAASRIGVDLASALAHEPRLCDAAILPVVTIPLATRPSVELTGRVPSLSARDLAVELARREVESLRPGMRVVDRLEIAPAAAARRLA
jgi:hypothetical protein